MYRCELCRRVSDPGVPRRTHVTYRTVSDRITGLPRSEVAREVAVCQTCQRQLANGVVSRVLKRQALLGKDAVNSVEERVLAAMSSPVHSPVPRSIL